MQSASDQQRIRLARHRQSWRVWDGSAVIFEPLSGDTHRVDRPGGDILMLLADAGTDLTRQRLADKLSPIATRDRIDEALNVLIALDLVEPS